ncbi:MAG: NADH-quinone oxidoreductase subunit L [Sandaracinaceae bacterium]|nr:NADH-quinone oxidoreductase subunit L [Sandaracinaceae bacterium]
MSFDVNHILLPIVLLPIFGALYNGIMGRRVDKTVVTTVAVGSVVGSFLLSLVGFGYLLSADASVPPVLVHDVYEWFSITVGSVDVPVRVRFVMDHLSGIMTVMVTGIGALIHVYSTGYMEDDPGYARFMAYLNLFMASMLVLVLASNFPLMFVGWEGVGLCSYLLIGYWFTNPDYAAAGKKAFIVNRIGDFGVLIGMFILVAYVAPRSADAFEFSTINAMARTTLESGLGLGDAPFSFSGGAATFTVATAAGLFIFLGCTGKSAQIPLFVWLPDAMAGPTPVSALIHAATMVTAGVYLCCRLSPVLVESPTCMAVIAITGALTALLAASVALVQNQMKRILAYSTVSQLGFMFSAVGMGAFAGGFFHVFTHAFFKACLFLGAGSVMHAVHAHGDADIRYLGGLRKKLPATHLTFLIATIAIAGLPPLAGFFSKDEILLGAMTWFFEAPSRWNETMSFTENVTSGNWAGGWVGMFVFVVLSITAAMTAFYMFRLYFRTFWGEYKGGHAPHAHHDEHGHEGEHGHGEHDDHWVEPHESPDAMTTPLWVLAIGAALVGFLGLPHLIPVHGINWWSGWLTPQHEEFLHVYEEAVASGAAHVDALNQGTAAARRVWSGVATLSFDDQLVHASPLAAGLAMGVGTTVALLGFLFAFLWYQKADGEIPASMMQRMPALHRFLMDKWRIDELYGATIVAPMKWLGVVAANLDRFLVDMVLTKLSAWAMKALGFVVTRAQNGLLYAYAAMFVVGFAGLTWWFTYPHPSPEGEETAVGQVAWTVTPSLGTEFRWDFDSDGEWDSEWTAEGRAEHDYASHRRADPSDHSGAQIDALVGVFETLADNFGPNEHVVAQGDRPVAIEFPSVIPNEMWLHPGARREGLAGVFSDWFPSRPALQMATVQRFQGRLPEGQVPQPGEDGKRRVRLRFSIHPLPTEGNASPAATWGPIEREVVVAEDGRFGVLLGVEEPLLPSQLPRAIERQDDGSELVRTHGIVRFGTAPEAQEAIDFAPQTGMVVHINDAAIRDDDIDDGLLLLEPGSRIPVGNEMFLTVAVQVRATVEARNAFGNTTRRSESLTLRVARRAHAQAEVAR